MHEDNWHTPLVEQMEQVCQFRRSANEMVCCLELYAFPEMLRHGPLVFLAATIDIVIITLS